MNASARRRRSNRCRPFLVTLPPAWVSVATGAVPIVRSIHLALSAVTR
ncbi:hypothetical protein Q7689_00950 [Nocardiopsis tropica]|nr:hypothetical protein [Nocardiopsis tropica]